MATSSIPAAIDYLVGQVTALPACALPVVVSDGWPDARADTGVAIGITPDDGDTEDDIVHSQLGAQMEREQYLVPCEIWVWKAGTGAVKRARDAAFVIYDAIVTRIRTDRTLGGALHSGSAIVANMRVRQTRSAPEAGEGRMCEIRFVVSCGNRF